jgi:hypothetical protein
MNKNIKKISTKYTRFPSTSRDWELDIGSRPILDDRGKKLWELLITDSARSFVFSQFIPSNKINSSYLQHAIEKLIQTQSLTPPSRCLFFRSQMENIISRALTNLNVKAVPSRRCFGLLHLLEERTLSTLKQYPGQRENDIYPALPESPTMSELPDSLRGEQWAFVQLPFSKLKEEVEKVQQGELFGSSPSLEWVSKSVSPNENIPGIAVFSRRAFPLAAWTDSHELAAVSTDFNRNCLVIDIGVNQRWLYGYYRTSEAAEREAEAWEIAKKKADGLHFLVIQSEIDSDDVDGLWIMWTRPTKL